MGKKKWNCIYLFVISFFLVGCQLISAVEEPQEMFTTPVATPASFEELINYLHSNHTDERRTGIWATLNYPDDQSVLIPLITNSIYELPNSEVRIAAVSVLGQIGQGAREAVPDLIWLLENDDYILVKRKAVIALGLINDRRAVPVLAEYLNSTDASLAGGSARSIGIIVGIEFPGMDTGGYSLNEEGVPYMAIAALEWWEETGRHIDWNSGSENK